MSPKKETSNKGVYTNRPFLKLNKTSKNAGFEK
jgi:hypothetical protein